MYRHQFFVYALHVPDKFQATALGNSARIVTMNVATCPLSLLLIEGIDNDYSYLISIGQSFFNNT